jgi:ribosomal protein S18 acetylase RimI-like enzyme
MVTTDKLFKLETRDIPKIIDLLLECFMEDPLYCSLIPDAKLREKTLPELFECDLEEMFQNCEIYADSEEINGLIVVHDQTEEYNPLKYITTEAFYTLKTDAYLIKEDRSLKTLWNFIRGKDYLNSHWTNSLPEKGRLHLIYFAVRESLHGQGIAHKMITPLLEYADKHSLYISLETHNPQNISIYEHYGFNQFKVLQCHMKLKQYCMLRPFVKDDQNIVKYLADFREITIL